MERSFLGTARLSAHLAVRRNRLSSSRKVAKRRLSVLGIPRCPSRRISQHGKPATVLDQGEYRARITSLARITGAARLGTARAETKKGICQPNCWLNSLVESVDQITGSNYWVEFDFEIAGLSVPQFVALETVTQACIRIRFVVSLDVGL